MGEPTMTQQGQGNVVERIDLWFSRDPRSFDRASTDLLRDCRAEISRLRTLLSSSRGEQGINAAEIAQNVAVRVAGLSDRTSPDDWPEAMLVTSEELHLIVMSEIHEALYDAKYAPGSVPTSLAGQVPDGYVLVPKEPTSEMLEAADAEYPRGSLIEKKLDRRKYKAMLSAAPQPTAGGDAPTFETPKSEPNLEPSNLFDVESVSTDDTDFNRIRDLAFPAIRKHVPCDKPPLIYGCERAECICAEAACDVAGAVSDALSAERARVIEECAKWHESRAVACTTLLAMWHRDSAAALRALGQQDTGDKT